MHIDGIDHLQVPAWAADLLWHLGQGGPLTAGALTELLQAHHPGLTAEQVERELRARCEVHEMAGGWVSLLALADRAVLSHLLGAEERKAGVLAADGDLDLWARLADEGLPLAGGGMLRARWALGPHELPRGSNCALAGPDGWLEAFEDDSILTLRLRDGALEVGTLVEQAGEAEGAVAERVKTVVEACTGAALDALSAFADAAGVDHAEDDEEVGGHDQPNDPGAALDDVLAELLFAQPGVLDDPMPPLGLLLTAAGLGVTGGAVMLAGAPDDPDEVADLSSEEIRWSRLRAAFCGSRLRRRALRELFDGGYEPLEVAAFLGPQPPPLLHNREGHLLVQCTVTYDIPEATVEATWRQLAAELDEDDGPDRLLATGELDDGERAIRGSVHRQQCQLTIAANSVERLGELQQQVLAAAPGSQLVSESIVPMEELLAEGERDPQAKGDRDAEAQQLGFSPDEEAALLEQVMREYEQRWLDQKLPALGGRTPRQSAAEGGSALAGLHALLDDIQWRTTAPGGGMSAARIRRHLGLTDA